MRLRGTGAGEADDALMVALARFGDISCVVLGQQSRVDGGSAAIRPAALRQARRGMRLAAELALPLVTLIDTPGGELSAAAEEGGLAGEIARCIADMLALDVPTVSVLLGQGTGGTALALLPADRIIAAANGWLSPLPPEGASAILYRSTSKAAEVAERQSIRAVDLRDCGVIDRIVAEQPDAADEPGDFCHRIVAALRAEIALAANSDPDTRSRCRAGRFDRLGNAPSATVDQLAG